MFQRQKRHQFPAASHFAPALATHVYIFRFGDSPLSQRAAIEKVHGVSQMSSCTVIMFLYPSIRVRTAPPVSVRVRARDSLSFSFTSNS